MVKKDKSGDKPSFKEAFNSTRNKLTPHTKKGNTYGEVVAGGLSRNWAIIPSIIAIAVAGVVALNSQSAINTKTQQITQIESKIKGLQSKLDSARNGSKEKVVKKTIDVKMNNATAAGKKVIDLETELMESLDLTIIGEDSPLDVKHVTKVSEDLRSMTGMNETEVFATWIKLPTWTIEFKSVVSYEGNEIPSLFILKDDKGELMGLVTAVYHADTDSFSNVNVTYTTAGDAVNYNRGGR